MKRETDSPDILFEDDSLLALNKPDGLLISPDRWNKDLPNLMRYVHKYMSPHYFNAHRLDKDTSGVVLCAKNKKVLDRLTAAFENHEVEKHYLALTQGVPQQETFTVQRPITNDDRFPGRMKLSEHGKPCETNFQTMEKWRGYALVQATPLTGRTHQIRLHLAAVKCPIIADRFYGYGRGLMLSEIKKHYKESHRPERPLIGRLALHAESLSLKHPVTEEPIVITAPLPHDFELAMKYLRRFA